MTVRAIAFCATLALVACAPIRYEEASSPSSASASASVDTAPTLGLDVPVNPPMREPYTTYRRILADTGSDAGKQVVGYSVSYDALPAHMPDVERSYPTGTVFIEDRKFQRVGFLTSLGKGFRYEGGTTEEVGQGTIEYLLPHYFAGTAFEVTAME